MTDPVEGDVIAADSSAPIVAKAGRYYRNARYLMTLGLLVMGGLFAYDGYERWPEHNKQVSDVNYAYAHSADDMEKAKYSQLMDRIGAAHTDNDIWLQKVLGYALPVAALLYLTYVLHKSRGEIRLAGDTLSVPGHPPVPLAAVTSVDHRLWKKKGIAAVKYDVAGQRGTITLDDFVYQQVPVDAIYDRLVAQTATTAAQPGVTGTAGEVAPPVAQTEDLDERHP